MSNLILKINNSEFVEHNGVYLKKFSKKKIEGNGWMVMIDRNNSIKCEAKKMYSDGEYSMRYNVLKNGYAKLTLKTPQMEKARSLKEGFIVKKGEGIRNGILALSGGRIDERFAYFRGKSFVNLLDKYDLSGIKHRNPNCEYTMIYSNQYGIEREDTIDTDGNKEIISKMILLDNKKTGVKKFEVKVKVEDATFVVLKAGKKRFLYSMVDNIENLDLPHK